MEKVSTPYILAPQLLEALRHRVILDGVATVDAVLIDELYLESVNGRIDLAVVNSHLVGYEIKSKADLLNRLPREIEAYDRVMNAMTAVVDESHLRGTKKLIPQHWGLMVAVGTKFEHLRPAETHFDQEVKDLTPLLWKETAIAMLLTHNAAKGCSTKPKRFLHARLNEVCSLAEVHHAVCEQFKLHRRRR